MLLFAVSGFFAVLILISVSIGYKVRMGEREQELIRETNLLNGDGLGIIMISFFFSPLIISTFLWGIFFFVLRIYSQRKKELGYITATTYGLIAIIPIYLITWGIYHLLIWFI